MNGDHDLDYDSSTEHAWFNLDGSAAVVAETDDTTNNNDDVATGITVAVADWNTFQIDFNHLADVKFYINGTPVAGTTTFDMSNLTAAESYMQPYFGMAKTSDVGLGQMYIDYIKFWSAR